MLKEIVKKFKMLKLKRVYWRSKEIYGSIKLDEVERKNNEYVKSVDLEHVSLPVEVEIETVNRCNGSCPFCPVNVDEPQRPYAKMEEFLFYKIVDELREMNYSGNFALFSNNEPFLDERLVEFARYAREKLPNAFCHLYTNGSLLTVEKLLAIEPYLNRMIIDNYNDKQRLNKNVILINEILESRPELKKKIIISMRMQNEILNSRGGMAPNKKNKAKRSRAKCVLPFQQLIIRPDGKVSLCCADALGKYTMGDLSKSTIKEIWFSHEYMVVRKKMKKTGRKALYLCNKCDQVGGSL